MEAAWSDVSTSQGTPRNAGSHHKLGRDKGTHISDLENKGQHINPSME